MRVTCLLPCTVECGLGLRVGRGGLQLRELQSRCCMCAMPYVAMWRLCGDCHARLRAFSGVGSP